MFETLPDDAVYAAGFAIVTLLVVARLYAGEHYFNDQSRFWNPIRRTAIPLLHRLFQRKGDDLYAETTVGEGELVAYLEIPPEDVLEDLAAAGYEPQPLASLARDWAGRTEVASWARYEGPIPFRGAPDWLRPRQVHVRLFEDDVDARTDTVVVAHEEATAWRPDLWRDHYRGETMDVGLGRAIVADDLDVRLEDREETDAP